MVGYLATDKKIAIVGAQSNLEGQPFFLVEADNPEKVVYTRIIQSNRGNSNTSF